MGVADYSLKMGTAATSSSVRKHSKRTYSLRKYSGADMGRGRKHSKTVALIRDNSSSIISIPCSQSPSYMRNEFNGSLSDSVWTSPYRFVSFCLCIFSPRPNHRNSTFQFSEISEILDD